VMFPAAPVRYLGASTRILHISGVDGIMAQ
jgi:hypothetical protein